MCNYHIEVLMKYITWKMKNGESQNIDQKFIDAIGTENYRICIQEAGR